MGLEIERRFLVRGDPWTAWEGGVRLAQGYVARESGNTVRVRLAGDDAWLTIKGPSAGAARAEFEYAIPVADAGGLLALSRGIVIDKTRWKVPFAGWIWDVDRFHSDNEGLAIAEVELPREDAPVELPPWVGLEITGDHRYANSALASHPWSAWSLKERRESRLG